MKKPTAIAPQRDDEVPPELEAFVQSYAEILVADFFRREREASNDPNSETTNEKPKRHG